MESYIEIVTQENLKADQAARRAAEAADRANLLGPRSVAAELCANEARIASSCATTTYNTVIRVRESEKIEDAIKWVKVAMFASNRAIVAAEDAYRFAADETLYR